MQCITTEETVDSADDYLLLKFDHPDAEKTEFVKRRHFDSLEELELELWDYIHWYNHLRIHGTLSYMSPIQYKLEYLKKVV